MSSSFERNIFKLRKNNNLTQEELAEICNISRQTISKWETGLVQPDMDKCIFIAEYFNISLDKLLKGTVTEKNDVVYSFDK